MMREMVFSICRGCLVVLGVVLTVAAFPGAACAQLDVSAPHVFGFFQTSFHHYALQEDDANSFDLQQLNVFLSKDLTPRWRAFINFEFTNTFSTERNWGEFSIEEAWLGYSPAQHLHFKLGLLIPVFNNLNEIKNKTPLLPYVIRPIVYEASFADDLGAESFIPRRAFAQVYGFLGIPTSKLDYAFYIGNSPNIISRTSEAGPQSGVDSTGSFMGGGRVGVRRGEFKAGVSGTYEHTNNLVPLAELIDRKPDELARVPRYRLGADLSYRWRCLMFEGEHIFVKYESGSVINDVERNFTYFTLGCHTSEQLLIYGGYWWTLGDGFALSDYPSIFGTYDIFDEHLKLVIPVGGASYALNDQITLKAQYGYVDNRLTTAGKTTSEYFHILAAAISAMF